MWEYRADVVRVVDADTLDLDVDLGFGVRKRERVRLAEVDAWETRGPERDKGKAASLFVEELFTFDKTVMVRTAKDKKGKFGRYIAWIMLQGGNHDGCDLGELLIEQGHAEPWGE